MTGARSRSPDEAEWQDVRYCVFDAPSHTNWLSNRHIEVKPHINMRLSGADKWWVEHGGKPRAPLPYWHTVQFLEKLTLGPNIELVKQTLLPNITKMAQEKMDLLFDEVLDGGGEGIMLRQMYHIWEPYRTWCLLKHKPYQDAEGKVIGYVWGRETELGSKLLGLMGALVVEWNGLRFRLSGFTEAERTMTNRQEGLDFPGEYVREGANPMFPIGSVVTFKYRELTDDGLPKEARYFRKRNDPS